MPARPGLVDFAKRVCSNKTYLSQVLSSPGEILLYVYPIIFMVEYNVPLWDELRDYAISVLTSSLYRSTERLPHRMLDALYCLWWLDKEKANPEDFQSIFEQSNGAFQPHAGWNDLKDYYSFTHNIFYFTKLDMDHSRNNDICSASLKQCLDFGICRFVSEGNLDISLELIICQLVLGLELSDEALHAILRAIIEVESSGYVRGPDLIDDNLYAGAEHTWFCNYHTSLVAAIMFRKLYCFGLDRLRTAMLRQNEASERIGSILQAGRLLSKMANERGLQPIVRGQCGQQDPEPDRLRALDLYIGTLPAFVS